MNQVRISDLLRSIADAYDAGQLGTDPVPIPPGHTEGPVGPTLQAYRGPQDDAPAAYTSDGKLFARAYWVAGRMGAEQGASTWAYGIASQMMSMMGGTEPQHYRVVKAMPEKNPDGSWINWNSTLSKAWNLGWMEPPPTLPPTDDGWAAWREAMKPRGGK